MSRFGDLKGYVDSMEDDFNKFYNKGNKAAGTRVRKAMQELKRVAQDIRVEVLNTTTTVPSPKKPKKGAGGKRR